MRNPPNQSPSPLLLGIEGGATRTVAILANLSGQLIRRVETDPANLRLLTDTQLLKHLRALARVFPQRDAIGIGMAGVRGPRDQARVLRAAAQVWPGVPCEVSHDLDTALAAAENKSSASPVLRIIVLSGTGSCCYGRKPTGETAKVGGWGHLIGDKGSGYEIGLRALQAIVFHFDRRGIWSSLGQRILRLLQLNEPDDLIGWAQNADKREIAALATEVFEAWSAHDHIASEILLQIANSLAADAVTCALKLVPPGSRVQFVFAGGVLLKQPRFAMLVARRLHQLWPKAVVGPLKVESAWGAVAMARRACEAHRQTTGGETQHRLPALAVKPQSAAAVRGQGSLFDRLLLPESWRRSPTEQRNPHSLNLHSMRLSEAIELMLGEERRAQEALRRELPRIERAIHWITRALRQEGRLFYVGAGTSGRLGVLDASECPPTFGVSPGQVQGIIAGGPQALWCSVEGAEDNPVAGAQAIRFRGVKQPDVVVGIAASGRTPFVWGALAEARRRRAKTILICFNPYLTIPRALRPNLVIAPETGPEVLTGSTRLKAGTVTKLLLNLFTTLTMVRLGKVVSNLMVDLNPSNAKLRDRAVRILRDLTGADETTAHRALEEARWVVKTAWRKLSQ